MENILLEDVVQSPLKRKKLSNENNNNSNNIYIVRENIYEPPPQHPISNLSNNNYNISNSSYMLSRNDTENNNASDSSSNSSFLGLDKSRGVEDEDPKNITTLNSTTTSTSSTKKLPNSPQTNSIPTSPTSSKNDTGNDTDHTGRNKNNNNNHISSSGSNENSNNTSNELPSSPISNNHDDTSIDANIPQPPPIVVNSVVLYTIKDITNRLTKDFKELANCMLHCCPLLYEHSAVKNAQSIVEKLNSTIMASLEGLHKNQTQQPPQQHLNYQQQIQHQQQQNQYQNYTSPPQLQQPQPNFSLQNIHHYNQNYHQAQYQQLTNGITNNNNNTSTSTSSPPTSSNGLQHPSFQQLLQSIYQPIVQQQQLLQQKINEQPQTFLQAYQQQQPHLKYFNPYIIPSPMIPNHNQHINVNNLINNPIIYKPPTNNTNNNNNTNGIDIQQLHQQQQQAQIQNQYNQQAQIQQYNQHLSQQVQEQPQQQSQQQSQQQQQQQQQQQMSKSSLLNNLVNSLSQIQCVDFSKSILSDYQLLDQLGTGSFAKVRLCKHFETGRLFCMKILNQNKIIRLRQEIHVCNEKEVLLLVEHPFIVKLYATYKDSRYLYFLQEFIPCGELFDYIRRHGSLSQKTTQLCAAEIVLALEYLHSQDIIYRDLKPENVLIDHQGHIKLTDFGFAKKIKENTKSMCGTPEYIAPEILSGHGHGKSADWWSLGILIYEMLVGVPPFINNEGSTHDIFKMILEGKIIIPSDIDSASRDIIEKLVVVDVERRLGSLEGGVEDIKNHPFFEDIDWSRIQTKELPPLEPILKPIKHYPTMDDDRFDEDDTPSSIKPEILEQRKKEFFSNF